MTSQQQTLEEFLTTPAVAPKPGYFVKGFEAARSFIELNTPETVSCFNCSVSEYCAYLKGWNQGIKEFSHSQF